MAKELVVIQGNLNADDGFRNKRRTLTMTSLVGSTGEGILRFRLTGSDPEVELTWDGVDKLIDALVLFLVDNGFDPDTEGVRILIARYIANKLEGEDKAKQNSNPTQPTFFGGRKTP